MARDLQRQLVSLDEAAESLGLSRRTLRRRISDGTLPAFRVGPRAVRVDVADLERLARPIPTAGTAA
jgi:excisionase family DNA binding protein